VVLVGRAALLYVVTQGSRDPFHFVALAFPGVISSLAQWKPIHQHCICLPTHRKEEREREGKALWLTKLLLTTHWPCLAAREAGRCSLWLSNNVPSFQSST